MRVDVVQLHVSAVDKSNRFVKGLAQDDFTIQEDGRPQEVTGFEVAEKLPLTIGLVVDGSGSMEKAMPFVHEASAELFRGLIREKDRGFVIEFREQPRLIQDLTGDSAELQRAAREPAARGRDGPLRLGRPGPLPVPGAPGPQGARRRDRRRGQPLPRRLRRRCCATRARPAPRSTSSP